MPSPAPSPSPSPSIESLVTECISLCSSSPPPSAAAPPPSPSPLLSIRSDLVLLLSLLGKEATALSLAFKPPASVEAVKGTLIKMKDLLGKLAFCVGSLPSPSAEGPAARGALAKEISWIAQEAFDAIRLLLQGSLSAYQLSLSSSTTDSDQKKQKQLADQRQHNLNLTGAVWELVERSKEVSPNELAAARKEWRGVLGMLDDCLEEVKEMELSSPGTEEEEDEDEDDFRSSHPLSPTELARVSAVHLLLRLGRLLLNRLINSTALLSSSSSSHKFPLETLEPLVHQLSSSADDLALSLEPPQEDLEECVEEWLEVVRELADQLEQGATFEGEGEGNAEGKWLAVWRKQVEVAEGKLGSVGGVEE